MNRACSYCGLALVGSRSSDEPEYCCLGCRLAESITRSHGEKGEIKLAMTLLGVAIFLSMNVMAFSILSYGQDAYGPGEAAQPAVGVELASFLRSLAMLFSAPVIAILGTPVLRSALEDLGRRRVSTELLISIGVLAAYALSVLAVLRDQGSIYFDTACMILILITVGKTLEARGRLRASDSLRNLAALLPETVAVEREGSFTEIPRGSVREGDVVRVKPGERLPVDGVVGEGESSVDEKTITGESVPVGKRAGQTVYAGTLNLDGLLAIRATAPGTEAVVDRMIALLRRAQREKGRFQSIADRIATVFVPAVVLIAGVGAVRAGQESGVEGAVLVGLSVLLVSCPCSLGLATPLAVWVALGRAAHRGVLLKKSSALETLARVKSLCFDKTGTLTHDELRVHDVTLAGSPGSGEDEVLSISSGLAGTSLHPVSAAIVSYARRRGVGPRSFSTVKAVPGRGVLGRVNGGTSGTSFLGSPQLMAERELVMPESVQSALERHRAADRITACVGWDGRVQAVFGVSEQEREEARSALQALRNRKLELRVLSGDREASGARLSRSLEVPVESSLLPEDKIARVHSVAAERGPVAMVGEGVNDAPALASADVGIALGCGADVTVENADVCLLASDLDALPWLIDLSRKTVTVIKQNLLFAFGYNALGIPLALTGRLTPVFAAIAMILSSTVVVTNSLRLNRVTLEAEKP